MKNKLTLIILLLFSQFAFSQATVINIKEYHSKSIIFSKDYSDFLISDLKERFTPDSNEIRAAEKFLFKNNIHSSNCRKQNFRQYFGYHKNGHKELLIVILNFKNEKSLLKTFPFWQSKYTFVLTDIERLPPLYEYSYSLKEDSIKLFKW